MLPPAALEKLIFSGGGFLIAAVLGIAAYFIKEYLGDNKSRVNATTSDVKALTRELHEFKVAVANAVSSLKTEIQVFDRKWSEQHIKDGARFDQLSMLVTTYAKDIAKLEGRIEEHMGLLSSQISMNRAIHDKLLKLFEYVDVKERATDAAKRRAHPEG